MGRTATPASWLARSSPPLVPKLCLGTRVPKLCFASGKWMAPRAGRAAELPDARAQAELGHENGGRDKTVRVAVVIHCSSRYHVRYETHEGPHRRVGRAARPVDPGGGRELRLRHHPPGAQAV